MEELYSAKNIDMLFHSYFDSYAKMIDGKNLDFAEMMSLFSSSIGIIFNEIVNLFIFNNAFEKKDANLFVQDIFKQISHYLTIMESKNH